MHTIFKTVVLDEESPIKRVQVSESELKLDATKIVDHYMISCAMALSGISNAMDKAKLAVELIGYEQIKRFNTEAYSTSEVISLFYETAIIRAQSIYDRVLIFTNKLLDLGISNECISHNALVTNDKVKEVGLDAKLKQLNSVCNKYRLTRNTIIHHDRYRETTLDMLLLIHETAFLSQKTGTEYDFDSKSLETMTAGYLEIKRDEIDSYLDSINAKLEAIFDVAQRVYIQKKAHYGKL